MGAWYLQKYFNTKFFVTVNNITIIYILYLQVQHSTDPSQQATVKLVDDGKNHVQPATGVEMQN